MAGEEELKLRTQARGKATRLLKVLAECLQSKPDQDDLALAIHHLEYHISLLKDLQIGLDKLQLFDESSHMQEMCDEVFKAKRVLARVEKESEVLATVTDKSPSHAVYRKFHLDFKLPKFGGEVEAWPEFWSLFRVSVAENDLYAPVEKLVHLKACLTGPADVAIQGLPFTDLGYQQAVETLQERFDRPAFRRQTIMQKLLGTAPVGNDTDLPRLHG